MLAKKNFLDKLTIEPVRSGDWPALAALEKEGGITPFAEAQFQKELQLKNAHILIARLGDRIVGYIDFWQMADELELINIVVAKDCRRQGLAQKLLQTMFDFAKIHQIQSIHLEVRVSNEAAIMLYEKAGFQKVGLRKKYYPDNREDALIYIYNSSKC